MLFNYLGGGGGGEVGGDQYIMNSSEYVLTDQSRKKNEENWTHKRTLHSYWPVLQTFFITGTLIRLTQGITFSLNMMELFTETFTSVKFHLNVSMG